MRKRHIAIFILLIPLLTILGGCSGGSPTTLAGTFTLLSGVFVCAAIFLQTYGLESKIRLGLSAGAAFLATCILLIGLIVAVLFSSNRKSREPLFDFDFESAGIGIIVFVASLIPVSAIAWALISFPSSFLRTVLFLLPLCTALTVITVPQAERLNIYLYGSRFAYSIYVHKFVTAIGDYSVLLYWILILFWLSVMIVLGLVTPLLILPVIVLALGSVGSTYIAYLAATHGELVGKIALYTTATFLCYELLLLFTQMSVFLSPKYGWTR